MKRMVIQNNTFFEIDEECLRKKGLRYEDLENDEDRVRIEEAKRLKKLKRMREQEKKHL